MDDYQAIRLMQHSVGGIIDTVEKRKGDEILMGLKSGTIDPDSLGDRPYERQAIDSWRMADTENYMKKYSGMSHDQIQDVDPSQEENPLHATMAYSKVMGFLADNEQVKASTIAARMQRGMAEYKIFDAERNQVNRYIANGENDLAGNMVADMLSNSFYPGQAKYDAAKGVVKVYRKIISADDMGSPLQLENEIPISEVGKTLNDIDGKKYSTAKAIMTEAAANANRASLSNPKQYVNPETGKSIFASSLVNLNNLSESYFVSHDSKGKQVQIKDIGVLMGMGYMPIKEAQKYAKMQKTEAEAGKAMVGLSKEEALAGKYRAQTGKAEAETEAIREGPKVKDPVAYNQKKMGYIDKKEKEERTRLEDSGYDQSKINKAITAWRQDYEKWYDEQTGISPSETEQGPVTWNEADIKETLKAREEHIKKDPSIRAQLDQGLADNGFPMDRIKKEQKPISNKKAGLSAASKEDKKKVSNIASGLRSDTKKDDAYTNADGRKFKISQLKNPKVRNGVLWAEINGQTQKVQAQPSEKIYNNRYDNPEYANYMNLLKKLKLK